MAIGSHHSHDASTHEWLTPPGIIKALGPFDLDPCSPIKRPWPTAAHHFTKVDDGLAQKWFGRIWLNPPYSTAEITKWLLRMADHGNGTALIFARTETDAFFRYVWERATGLLFLRTPRLHFHYPDGTRAENNCGAPSVLCAYGKDDADVLASCEIDGHFVPLRLPRSVIVEALTLSWVAEIKDWLARQEGPVDLQDLYRAFANHPKAKANRNWKPKIRQSLQRGAGIRVAKGKYKAG